MGLVVEGLSFHVGSQCTNFENYVQALHLSENIISETETEPAIKSGSLISAAGSR